ncbi:MAG: bifunctional phosphopantothenoylcysteine decarboxylase/phosphopantothenate--cysteine ligase CoaBC, partial [Bacteroidota bacterium]
MLKGKRILVGVSGGIAAYKIPGLIRLLIKAGAEVKTIMTKDAENFVTKQTLSVVSKNKVEEEFFDQNGTWNNHVELGLWPDLILIAPATANTIGKMAHGMCDNLLIATYLSSRCPVMIAPAMDEDMYLHFSTDSNLKILSEKGHIIIEPESGELASGLTGKGRLKEPDEIFKFILDFLNPVFSGKKILINAGPTYEAIDPVRFIGNRSSGKTGIYLAEVFSLMGANVTLVLGPTEQNVNANKFKVTRVETAIEMLNACMEEFFDADIFIGSAAVSDYRIENPQNKKIKKE